MSSSFKQKKMKTLATRKRTHKRKMDMGMNHDDESGRFFQPPSRRDPRWKKPDASAVVETVITQAKKKRRVALLDGGDDDEDDDEDDGLPEMVDPIESDEEQDADEAEEETVDEVDDAEETLEEQLARKTPLKLCKSLEDCVESAVKAHQAIRRKDTRQKVKVLILGDSPAFIKALKKSLNVKAEAGRSKGKHGVRSSGDKQLTASYKHVGPVKTPLEKYKEANEDVLKDFKIGKLPTLLAEETSYYPFSDLALRHVIFLAKSPLSAINLDRYLLHDTELHTFVINDKGTALSAEDRSQLNKLYTISE